MTSRKKTRELLPSDYSEILEAVKTRIRSAQIKAAVAVNQELIQLYWDIGRYVVERQERGKWGQSIIERLAKDLKSAFPEIEGFSARNIWRMRAFYLAYTTEIQNLEKAFPDLDGQILPQAVAEIPWGHNVILLEKVKDPIVRIWYAQKTVELGWSRSVLTLQVENKLYERQG